MIGRTVLALNKGWNSSAVSTHRPAHLIAIDGLSQSARLPPAVLTEVRMRWIGLAVVLAFSVLAAPLLVETQQAKMYKIGLLSPPPGAYVAAFEETLRQLGYVRGRNVVFETRSSGYRAEDVPKAVADLLRLNVEVIVTGPNLFIDAAKQATTSIPIVMVYGRDPVGRRYISSLARPGGNITGRADERTAGIDISSIARFIEFADAQLRARNRAVRC